MSYNSGSNRARNFKSAYSLNCTPLGPITITNHNYIKILESDWSSAGLISAINVQLHSRGALVIVQLYASCLSNWTVHVIKLALVALEWLFFRHVA